MIRVMAEVIWRYKTHLVDPSKHNLSPTKKGSRILVMSANLCSFVFLFYTPVNDCVSTLILVEEFFLSLFFFFVNSILNNFAELFAS